MSPRSIACPALLAVVGLGAFGGAAQAATTSSEFRPFAPDSVWNQALRADAPLSPKSSQYSAFLNAHVDRLGGYVNSDSCGAPFYWAESNTPRVRVTLIHPSYMDPALMQAWSSVPMPADVAPANCSDGNFAILQRQSDGTVDEWEFFKGVKAPDGTWSASFGGATQDIERDRGSASSLAWSDPLAAFGARTSHFSWNVSASSLSMLGGVVTLDELRRGRIDHALALNVASAAKGTWMWPAQRSDGGSTDPAAIPEGAHLRIDPSVDLGALAMSPLVRMLAEAAQKYGVIVRDTTGGTNAFVAEQPKPGETNPVYALRDGQETSVAMRAFPWKHLQVLDATSCGSYSVECVAKESTAVVVESDGDAIRLDTRNSVLNQPREAVAWDLDGNGSFETDGAREVTRTVPLGALGSRVGVRITTRSGNVLTDTGAVPTSFGPVGPNSWSAAAVKAIIDALIALNVGAAAGGDTPAGGGRATRSPATGIRATASRVEFIETGRRSTVRTTLSCGSGGNNCRGKLTLRVVGARRGSATVAVRQYALGRGRVKPLKIHLGARATRRLGSSAEAKRLKQVRSLAPSPGRLSVDLGPAPRR